MYRKSSYLNVFLVHMIGPNPIAFYINYLCVQAVPSIYNYQPQIRFKMYTFYTITYRNYEKYLVSLFPPVSPQIYERESGFLMLLDGRTGKLLWNKNQYLVIPDDKESYMSPVLFTKKDGAQFILYGHGGETVPGREMLFTSSNFHLIICQFLCLSLQGNAVAQAKEIIIQSIE